MKSIRSTIFSKIFVVVILFFIVITSGLYITTTNLIWRFVVEENSKSLKFLINNIHRNYYQGLKSLENLAELPGLTPYDKNKAISLIQNYTRFNDTFSTVHAYESDGRLITAQRNKRNSNIQTYQTEDNFFATKRTNFIEAAQNVLKSGISQTSETLYTRTGILFQTYLVPFFKKTDKKEVAGFLSGGIFPTLQQMDHLVAGLKLAEDNFIVITDSRGNILAKNGLPENSSLQETVLRKASIPGEIQSITSEKISDDSDNSSYVLLSSGMPDLKLRVWLGVNTLGIKKKIFESRKYLALTIVLALLFSLGASLLLGHQLAVPIQKIAEGVNQLRRGNFGWRYYQHKEDELSQLGESLSKLARKIEKNQFLGDLWSSKEVNDLPTQDDL